MSNEYLIQKETLDNIASQSMSLVGKTAAVSTSDIVNDLTTANTEVGTQADLIEQIKDVINEKFADSNINISDSASTSTSSLSIQNNTTELQNFLTQANDLPDFVNTSDATATASDIANGVTAYVNGEKITGSVKTIEKDASWGFTDCVPQINSSGKVEMRGTWSGNRLYREGSIAFTHSDLSNFGDATAADVVAGKTFTSSAGLKVTGTKTESKTSANIVDFYVDYNSGYYTLALDKSLSNIEAIYLYAIMPHDDNSYNVLPPSNFFEDDILCDVFNLVYTDNIKVFSYGAFYTIENSGYDTSVSILTSMEQPSSSVVSLGYNEAYDGATLPDSRCDVEYYNKGAHWFGYAIGEYANQNTYYMKNIVKSYDHSFIGGKQNKYYRSGNVSDEYNICRLYFDFVTQSDVNISFNSTNASTTEYIVVGNLNQDLLIDYDIDNTYYYCSDANSGSYSKNITYTIPQGKNYIDIKVCANQNLELKSNFSFTVNIQ